MTVGRGPNDFNPLAAIVELIFDKGEQLSFREMDERFIELMEASGVSEADAVAAFDVWVFYMSHDQEKRQRPEPTQEQHDAMVRVAKQAARPSGRQH